MTENLETPAQRPIARPWEWTGTHWVRRSSAGAHDMVASFSAAPPRVDPNHATSVSTLVQMADEDSRLHKEGWTLEGGRTKRPAYTMIVAGLPDGVTFEITRRGFRLTRGDHILDHDLSEQGGRYLNHRRARLQVAKRDATRTRAKIMLICDHTRKHWNCWGDSIVLELPAAMVAP